MIFRRKRAKLRIALDAYIKKNYVPLEAEPESELDDFAVCYAAEAGPTESDDFAMYSEAEAEPTEPDKVVMSEPGIPKAAAMSFYDEVETESCFKSRLSVAMPKAAKPFVDKPLAAPLTDIKPFTAKPLAPQSMEESETRVAEECAVYGYAEKSVDRGAGFDNCVLDFAEKHESRLDERVKHLADSFSEYLFFLIEKKGLKNSQVYRAALVDRKIFSKMKNNPDYHPQKMTALCLCIGARLNLDEAKDLLARAGYALSPCDMTDVIFSYFLENEIYDMLELDIQLEERGLKYIV